MAAKTQAKPEVAETREETADGPLMDSQTQAVKKMLARSKERGYVTYDELNSVLPPEQMSSEQIEDTLAMLNEMGINVVESEESEEAPPAAAKKPKAEEEEEEEGPSGGNIDDDDVGRTDDPVRMYLREMGSVELLSREGEIAIAKRIEAGREAMIAGLCESPLTFQAIIIWRDELNDGKVFLRDIIDLEATYAGPDAKGVPAGDGAASDGAALQPPQTAAPATAPAAATPFRAKPEALPGEPEPADPPEGELDEDDLENSMSLAAIGAELKPKVLETFDNVADSYKRLRRLQDQDIENRLKNQSLSPAQERKYKKLKDEIIAEVKSLRLNQARIDSLVEQLYEINRRLVSHEGRMMRLAESHGVVREDFLKNYVGSELDPRWLNRVSKMAARGWKNLVAKDKDRIKDLRTHIHELAGETGLEIQEFRKIVHMVQKGEREARQAKKEMVEANLRLVISIADQARTIRIPVHMIETINKIVRTSRQMLHEIGREPTPEELAEKLGMPLEKVRKVLKIAKEPISLETPIGDEEDSHLGDFIEDKNAVLPIDAAIQSNLRETTTRVLASLTPREERVLRMRFGIGMNTDHTLEEVGQQFNVTRERIRQIEAKALRKLKHPSRSRKLRSFLDD